MPQKHRNVKGTRSAKRCSIVRCRKGFGCCITPLCPLNQERFTQILAASLKGMSKFRFRMCGLLGFRGGFRVGIWGLGFLAGSVYGLSVWGISRLEGFGFRVEVFKK